MPANVRQIDLNRGVHQARHKGGGLLSMYLDAPGEYFWEDHSPATVESAREAGFDVRNHVVEREKKRRLEQARRDIEREFEIQSAKIAEGVERDTPEDPFAEAAAVAASPVGGAAAQSEGFPRIEPVPDSKPQRFFVIDELGDVLETNLTQKEAEKLVATLTQAGQ